MSTRRLALCWVLVLCACSAGNAPGVAPDGGSTSPSDAGLDFGVGGAGPGQPTDLASQPSSDLGTSTGCGPCDHPPSQCYAPSGTCQGGKCVYAIVGGLSCDDGDACTVGDTCDATGACAGTPLVCDKPPQAMCQSGSQLLTYDQVGICKLGACVYTQKKVTCGAGGCVSNGCATDPCGAVSCDSPPSACFKPAGTCSGGQCSYGYDDGATCDDGDPCTVNDQCTTGLCKGAPKACLSPPADRCEDAATLRIYDPVGTCGAGACSYPYHFVTCQAGCAGGRCNATPWTALSSGVQATLHDVWGASGSDVFAVGDYGTILRGSGSQWKTMPVPQGTGNLIGIDGTSADNVFAITEGDSLASDAATILWWNGTAWQKRGTTYCGDFCCVGAIGTDDVYVWSSGGELQRITGGTEKLASRITTPITLYHQCNVRVRSESDVYIGGGYVYHYDGTTLSELATAPGTTHQGAYGLVAFGPTEVLAFAYNNVGRWDGSQWLSAPTGGNGALYGMGGTSFSRVFAVGGSGSGSTYSGSISFWDGAGWTGEMVPTGTPTLNAVWAAPTGEVYVVGASGTILSAVH